MLSGFVCLCFRVVVTWPSWPGQPRESRGVDAITLMAGPWLSCHPPRIGTALKTSRAAVQKKVDQTSSRFLVRPGIYDADIVGWLMRLFGIDVQREHYERVLTEVGHH